MDDDAPVLVVVNVSFEEGVIVSLILLFIVSVVFVEVAMSPSVLTMGEE